MPHGCCGRTTNAGSRAHSYILDAINFEALKIHSLLYISNRYELSRVARLQEKKDRQEQVSRYSGISMAKMNGVGIWASCLVASWPQ